MEFLVTDSLAFGISCATDMQCMHMGFLCTCIFLFCGLLLCHSWQKYIIQSLGTQMYGYYNGMFHASRSISGIMALNILIHAPFLFTIWTRLLFSSIIGLQEHRILFVAHGELALESTEYYCFFSFASFVVNNYCYALFIWHFISFSFLLLAHLKFQAAKWTSKILL
jgi:hypothetical protein